MANIMIKTRTDETIVSRIQEREKSLYMKRGEAIYELGGFTVYGPGAVTLDAIKRYYPEIIEEITEGVSHHLENAPNLFVVEIDINFEDGKYVFLKIEKAGDSMGYSPLVDNNLTLVSEEERQARIARLKARVKVAPKK